MLGALQDKAKKQNSIPAGEFTTWSCAKNEKSPGTSREEV